MTKDQPNLEFYDPLPEVILPRLLGERPVPNGSVLVSDMVRGLCSISALPVHVDQVDDWWIVGSQIDWLLSSNGEFDLEVFRVMRAMPELGMDHCRPENYIAAFAKEIVTYSPSDEPLIIKGSLSNECIERLKNRADEKQTKRVLAFRMPL